MFVVLRHDVEGQVANAEADAYDVQDGSTDASEHGEDWQQDDYCKHAQHRQQVQVLEALLGLGLRDDSVHISSFIYNY